MGIVHSLVDRYQSYRRFGSSVTLTDISNQERHIHVEQKQIECCLVDEVGMVAQETENSEVVCAKCVKFAENQNKTKNIRIEAPPKTNFCCEKCVHFACNKYELPKGTILHRSNLGGSFDFGISKARSDSSSESISTDEASSEALESESNGYENMKSQISYVRFDIFDSNCELDQPSASLQGNWEERFWARQDEEGQNWSSKMGDQQHSPLKVTQDQVAFKKDHKEEKTSLEDSSLSTKRLGDAILQTKFQQNQFPDRKLHNSEIPSRTTQEIHYDEVLPRHTELFSPKLALSRNTAIVVVPSEASPKKNDHNLVPGGIGQNEILPQKAEDCKNINLSSKSVLEDGNAKIKKSGLTQEEKVNERNNEQLQEQPSHNKTREVTSASPQHSNVFKTEGLPASLKLNFKGDCSRPREKKSEEIQKLEQVFRSIFSCIVFKRFLN